MPIFQTIEKYGQSFDRVFGSLTKFQKSLAVPGILVLAVIPAMFLGWIIAYLAPLAAIVVLWVVGLFLLIFQMFAPIIASVALAAFIVLIFRMLLKK